MERVWQPAAFAAGTLLEAAVDMNSVLILTALSAVAMLAWFAIMATSRMPLEAEGLDPADEADTAAVSGSLDPLERRQARIRRDQARASRPAPEGSAVSGPSAPIQRVVKRVTVRTGAGPMRVTVSGCLPSEARLTLLTVSNPGADTFASYGPFLDQMARSLRFGPRACIVSVDLPGLVSHAGEFEDGAPDGEPAPELPRAPALVSFSGLSDAVVDCAAAVGVTDAVGIGCHAGAWLLLSAQAQRPALLRALVVGGATAGPPKGGEAATLGALSWGLSSSGWTDWSRKSLAASMLSDNGAVSPLGLGIRASASDWDASWAAALLAGWSSRPLLTDAVLRSAVIGSTRYGSGKDTRGGTSALRAVVLLRPAVPGAGLPMCGGSPEVGDVDALSTRLNTLFADKDLAGSCSVVETPGGPLTISEAPGSTISTLRCVLLGLGHDV